MGKSENVYSGTRTFWFEQLSCLFAFVEGGLHTGQEAVFRDLRYTIMYRWGMFVLAWADTTAGTRGNLLLSRWPQERSSRSES